MQRLAASYGDPRVGVMGSHSALEVMDGAKDEGLRTAVYCQRGRDAPYRRFSRVADEVITLPRFADMASARVQRSMREAETVVVPHRSFAVYIGYSRIENSFRVPLFGNRAMLRAEERDEAKNQYDLLRRARISHPRVVEAKDISGPCIVKVQEGKRRLERAFFTVSSRADYEEKSQDRLRRGVITRAGLRRAAIEELAVGTYMNFNFFSTPLTPEAEFLGVERRLQSNIHDYNALPARQQLELDIDLQNGQARRRCHL